LPAKLGLGEAAGQPLAPLPRPWRCLLRPAQGTQIHSSIAQHLKFAAHGQPGSGFRPPRVARATGSRTSTDVRPSEGGEVAAGLAQHCPPALDGRG